MERQFVSFRIADIKYCVDIMDVQEVYREDKITRMPDVPPFVEGIINLRGIVIPVISIRKKLSLVDKTEDVADDGYTEDILSQDDLPKSQGLEKSAYKSMKLIIVNIEGVWVGFKVDHLERVFSVEQDSIQPAEGVASGVDRSMVDGVARLGDEVFIILNAKKLLDVEEKQYIKDEIIE